MAVAFTGSSYADIKRWQNYVLVQLNTQKKKKKKPTTIPVV
jgi:hypothetical protein